MATADLTLKETPTAEQESVIRTLATMIAAQNLVVDFTRWQKSPEGTTPEGVTKLLNGLGAFIAANAGADPDAPPTSESQAVLLEASALTEREIDAAVTAIVAGLSRAYPQAAREDLMDMPISVAELVGAITAVIAQTSLAKPASEASPSGEVHPAETPA